MIVSKVTALIAKLDDLPYAYLDAKDVETMKGYAAAGKYAPVWEMLSSDASTNEACGNYGRAEVTQEVAESFLSLV